MDISKYLTTVGLIGGVLTNNLSIASGIVITSVVVTLAIIGFYVIPKNN